jgi:CheY-like chemotaxis protein
MQLAKILWVDDEIESLQSQILFLEGKGYAVQTKTNGFDAIDYLQSEPVDLVLLDESMPGISGLQTLQQIKEKHPQLPVVLVTKNEAENLMDEAIGRQISDYLIKPVNPNQVWLSLKKLLDNKRLVAETTHTAFQQEFFALSQALNEQPDHRQWIDLYRKLVFWEGEMQKSASPELLEVLTTQKSEANHAFFKYISRHYSDWVLGKTNDRPVMSHDLIAQKVIPFAETGTPMFFVLIDNLRYDQWKAIQPIFAASFRQQEEDCFFSILPTATQYARNALFAGMMPGEIRNKFPDAWKNDDEDGGKNLNEEMFLREQLKRLGKSDWKVSYTKVLNHEDGQRLVDQVHNLMHNDLNVIVYNFVDMLSHARTEMEVLKELAADEVSYRSLTASWFEHSPLHQALKRIAEKKIRLVLATDHGSTRVRTPSRIIGDRQTTANLRYKHGRNLDYEDRDVLAFRDPRQAGLPVPNVNSMYVFAKGDVFLCYPNNYNHHVQYYRNTFQHGGISLEEMVIPVVHMISK